MRRLAIVIVLLAACLGVAAADTGSGVAPDPLAGVMLQRIAESEEPACVVVALVEEKTRFAFGCTKDAPPVALDVHSLFEIGSITKAFTGILLADMVLKGEVSLDDPASKYSRPGAKLPTRGGQEITLRDLATQTSGLPGLPPAFAPADPTNPYADFDADKLYEALAATDLRNEIGTHYDYSNFGFMWLSEMLSRIGGGTYEEVLRKRVLQPLGMSETVVTMDESRRKRFIAGHDGNRAAVPHWDFAAATAGVGGLRSSAADMAKLAEAVAGLRDTPLQAAIELALKPDRVGRLGMIGLAWMESRTPSGRTIYWHNGGTAGFRSMVAVDRNARRASVVLVNAASPFDDLAMRLLDPSYPIRAKRIAVKLDEAVLGDYVSDQP